MHRLDLRPMPRLDLRPMHRLDLRPMQRLPPQAPKRPTVRRIGKRVVNLAAGTKFTVKFDYAHRPVGEYKPDYVTRQGVVVRNAHITSLAYKSRHKVPQEMKQKMMDVVLELCRKNKEQRSAQQMHHRTGKKSFAVIADNEAGTSGPPPSRLKMFELAYGKASSSYKEGFTQQKADEINELLAARDQGLNSLTDDEIFMQVFGEERPGRVRCMGPGHTLTSRWGRRPSRVEFERDREERRKQNEDIARRLEMADAHQAQLEAHQAQIEARLQSQFEEQIRHMQAAHDEQMRRMMDEFFRRMMHTTNEQQPPP